MREHNHPDGVPGEKLPRAAETAIPPEECDAVEEIDVYAECDTFHESEECEAGEGELTACSILTAARREYQPCEECVTADVGIHHEELMGRICPTCEAVMESKGAAGKGRNGLPQAVSWQECPECETIVSENGDVSTKMDQIHDEAWRVYANAKGDWSIIPRYV